MYGSVPEPASASVGTPEAEIRLSLSSAAVDGGSTGAGSSAGGGGVRWATPVQSICSSRPSTPPTRTLKPPSHAPASTRVPPARLSASEAAGAAGGSSESGSKTGGGRVRAPCTPSWYERVSLLPSAVGLKRITVWSVGKSEVVVVSASTLAMSNDGANRYRHPSSGGTGGAGTRHAGSPRMSHSCQAPKGRYVLLYIANRRESTAWRDSGTGRWKASSSTSSRASDASSSSDHGRSASSQPAALDGGGWGWPARWASAPLTSAASARSCIDPSTCAGENLLKWCSSVRSTPRSSADSAGSAGMPLRPLPGTGSPLSRAFSRSSALAADGCATAYGELHSARASASSAAGTSRGRSALCAASSAATCAADFVGPERAASCDDRYDAACSSVEAEWTTCDRRQSSRNGTPCACRGDLLASEA
eukprot:scaffold9015_cov96-Isochrysis_galbana.AAC.5